MLYHRQPAIFQLIFQITFSDVIKIIFLVLDLVIVDDTTGVCINEISALAFYRASPGNLHIITATPVLIAGTDKIFHIDDIAIPFEVQYLLHVDPASV